MLDGHLLLHVIEHIPIGVLILERDSSVMFVNQYVLTLFNAKKEDFIGVKLSKLVETLKDKLDVDATIKEVLNGTLNNFKITLTPNDSPDVVCLYNSFVVEAVDPYPECVALVVQDITKEQKVVELIETKNIEMARLNSELTRSNSELKKVSELKSNFLSLASHELNTPLTSIKGYSDIIIDNMREKVDPSVFRMIESISRAADRLHKVVNSILDVTKIERGKLRLRPEYIDLGAIMHDCCEEVGQLAEKRKIAFRTSMDENLPLFYGDKPRMQQMFINLLNNALKYSPDESDVLVNIKIDNGHFHITIKDHGIGIDKGELKNIFDPFYEVGTANRHSTDASKFMGGGSGLGLSIVRGIVMRHGGTVWAESDGSSPGMFLGSTFHIMLPLHSEISWDDDESKVAQSRLEEANALAAASASGENERFRPLILFIDPDKKTTDLASTTMEDIFDVLVADSGEQGLFIAFSHKPSLILMDTQLPGLDGYKICRILRSQDETREIPIAFFSSSTADDVVRRCFACGADDFIVKPFSGRELVEKICHLLLKKNEEDEFK